MGCQKKWNGIELKKKKFSKFRVLVSKSQSDSLDNEMQHEQKQFKFEQSTLCLFLAHKIWIV